MNLQKLIFTIFLAFSSLISIHANAEMDVKNAISLARTVYMGWQSGSCMYLTPGPFVKDETDKVIGQKFYSPNKTEFMTFKLEEENEQSLKINIDGRTNVYLDWDGSKFSRIYAKHMLGFDYQVTYNGANKIQKLVNPKGAEILFAYEGNQIKTITATYIQKGKTYTRSIRTLLKEDGANFEMSFVSYKRGKPMKDKFTLNNLTCSCEKIGERKYKVLHGWQAEGIYQFDELERIVENSLVYKNGNENAEKYYYDEEGNVARKETANTENGVYQGKLVRIFKIIETKSSAQVADWETRKGVFKLNAKGELVYEAINTKCRKKVNGVWGAWENIQFCGVK